MATLVVVMGPTAAGKTTVGRALAARLGVPFHDADDHHSEAAVARMRSGHALTDVDRWPWLDRLRDLLARELAAGRGAVLACSALRRAYRERLVPDGAPPHTPHFVLLDVPREVLAERLGRRTAHYMPASLLDSQLATLEAPDPDEGALTVRADRSVADVVQDIELRLAAGGE